MALYASDYDKSKYLRAEDIKQPTKLRIANVTEELIGIGADKEQKLAVRFTNHEQLLVLNKTNIRTLRGAFDDDTAGWVGKVIVVFPTMVDFRGKMVPSLRVRIPPPKGDGAAGNGAAARPATSRPAPAAADEELEPDLVKPLSEEMDDQIPF